jgi:hypothetical protein
VPASLVLGSSNELGALLCTVTVGWSAATDGAQTGCPALHLDAAVAIPNRHPAPWRATLLCSAAPGGGNAVASGGQGAVQNSASGQEEYERTRKKYRFP